MTAKARAARPEANSRFSSKEIIELMDHMHKRNIKFIKIDGLVISADPPPQPQKKLEDQVFQEQRKNLVEEPEEVAPNIADMTEEEYTRHIMENGGL